MFEPVSPRPRPSKRAGWPDDCHRGVGRRHVGGVQPVAADQQGPLIRPGGLCFEELNAVFNRQVSERGLLPVEQHTGAEQAAGDFDGANSRPACRAPRDRSRGAFGGRSSLTSDL